MTPPRSHCPAASLQGVGASPGRFTGRARVAHSLAGATMLAPGEILVCRAAAPGWTPALTRAGALVAETGGILSSAATIARGLRLPAVVAAPGAATMIADGTLVTVDGDAGTVTLAPSGPA